MCLVSTVEGGPLSSLSTSTHATPDNILGCIGGTPLLRLRRVASAGDGVPEGVEVYAKAEHMNPSGSVKDRAALAMVLDGLQSGALTPDKTILDATSGNTGIAYAMIGAAMRLKVAVCLPSNASPERKRILRIHGCDIVDTDPLTGTDGAQAEAKRLAGRYPQRYFHPASTYVIVSAMAASAGQLHSWELRDDRSGFDAETIDDTFDAGETGPLATATSSRGEES